MPQTFKETDMYPPIRAFLESRGFTVRSEVQHCDVAAVRGDEVLVVEMKKSLNVNLLVQAVQRQKLTGDVYVAVPRPKKNVARAEWRGIRQLLRRLELGLMFVAMDSTLPDKDRVHVAETPRPYQSRRKPASVRSLLKEINGRTSDYNQGGSTQRPLMTAYREQALFILTCLHKYGPMSPKALKDLGTGDKTQMILGNNVYRWFQRVEKGIYDMTDTGQTALHDYSEVVLHYLAVLEKQNVSPQR